VKQTQNYWNRVAQQSCEAPYYLDAFLGEMKRQAHLALIERWGGLPAAGRNLKTDLFEEATGLDAFLLDLGECALVVGMDVSRVVAGKAAGRDPERRAGYLVADARRLPFADSVFTLVVSPSTLDHFENPQDLGRSLRELARVLSPGGRLIITLDNRDNIFDPLLRLAGRMGLVPYFLGRSYRASELRSELEAVGLSVEAETVILHNPRLVAVGAVMVANRMGWLPLVRLVRRALVAAQAFEHTRLRYRTGSFIATLARKPG
jgi:SAM-dependent methyltransferase